MTVVRTGLAHLHWAAHFDARDVQTHPAAHSGLRLGAVRQGAVEDGELLVCEAEGV